MWKFDAGFMAHCSLTRDRKAEHPRRLGADDGGPNSLRQERVGVDRLDLVVVRGVEIDAVVVARFEMNTIGIRPWTDFDDALTVPDDAIC